MFIAKKPETDLSFLGWEYPTISQLENWLEKAKNLDITEEDIKAYLQKIEETSIKPINIHSDEKIWFYAILDYMFREIVQELKEKFLLDRNQECLDFLEELTIDFDPVIEPEMNNICFNNILDEIDFFQDRETILLEVEEKIKEQLNTSPSFKF